MHSQPFEHPCFGWDGVNNCLMFLYRLMGLSDQAFLLFKLITKGDDIVGFKV